jgi:NAD(P)-dependent dehydrogenase (short-subunit alcohol dehydrogenase family)
MEKLHGRVAAITGGGSGIGEALGHACAAEGMKVVLGDVEGSAAERVAEELRRAGAEAIGVALDVRDAASVDAFAARTDEAFGACHLLANNAGVVLFRRIVDMELEDWQWILSVNLLGVVHGIHAFLPRMRAHGQGGHIVNTASIAGLVSMGDEGLGAYVASKYGVVGLSEVLRSELAAEGIGVSVLCPGGVATRITESERNRPEELRSRRRRGRSEPARARDDRLETGQDVLPPAAVAARVLRAVREDELYVVTHPGWKSTVDARHAAISVAFASAAARERSTRSAQGD